MKTRLFAFLLVLALCSSSVFAFAPLGVFSKPSEEPVQTEPAAESKKTSKTSTETILGSEISSTSSEVEGMSYDELKDYIDGKFILTPNQVKEITKAVDKVGTDIETLKKDLAKEKTGTKFFADLGAAFGFGEGIQFGAVADMGMRFGKGWMFKVGGQYMVGGTDEVAGILNHDWTLKNATIQTTVGFEW